MRGRFRQNSLPHALSGTLQELFAVKETYIIDWNND